MRHRIVLYNPQAVFWTMPLALVAVGSALDRSRFSVEIVDGRHEPVETLLAKLEGALCLGLTVLTGAPLGEALQVSRRVRARYPQLPIVWGGWHPSLFADSCAAEGSVTAAVVGQGERTFVEIVDRLAAGSGLDGVRGCHTADDSEGVLANPPRAMTDINGFPRHDYGLVDVEAYFEAKKRRQLDYVTSQGCRFRCSFCADPAVFKRGWYGLEPERVISEVVDLHSRYRFTDLGLQDETYFTSPRRVAAIAEGFLASDCEFTWYGTLRADQGRRLDDDVFALCRASGLRDVVMGLEAGAPETLAAIGKDITLDDIWDTADKLLRHGIGATIGVIVGFPGESDDSVDASLEVARRLRRMSPEFRISVFYYKPYPGNPIADRLQADGYRFPDSLDEWAGFDYVGDRSEWLDDRQCRRIEGFKFSQRYAYTPYRNPLRWPLHALSRWRVERHDYRLPLEKLLVERLRPPPQLS